MKMLDWPGLAWSGHQLHRGHILIQRNYLSTGLEKNDWLIESKWLKGGKRTKGIDRETERQTDWSGSCQSRQSGVERESAQSANECNLLLSWLLNARISLDK